MSLSKARQNRQDQSQEASDDSHLNCAFPGCGARWSVRLDGSRGYCSFHQWGKGPYAEKKETPFQREVKAGMKRGM